MRPILAVFSARFRLLLQYRAAAAAGLLTQVAWGFFLTMGLAAYYRSASTPPPLSFEDMVTYTWLGQALFALLPWMPDPDLRAAIRTGHVAYELLRPVGLYSFWFARALAGRTAPTLLRAIPLAMLALAFFGMARPPSLGAGGAFAIAMIGAIALSAAITVLLSLSLFWTLSGDGITQAAMTVVPFFAGMVLPLPLFPDWSQPIFAFLPFRGMVDAPYRLYSGNLPVSELGAVLLHQWAWVAVLVLAGQWLLGRALRRVIVQGG